MLTVIGVVLMVLGFLCVLAACSMELTPQEAYMRPAPPSRRSRRKVHKLPKLKKAA
jgi:hypothetical protein